MSFLEIIFLLDTYKYFLLFPIVVVEGPIITVIAGFLSSLGQLNLWLAYLVVVAGDIAGDAMYYGFGYYGRKGFIDRFGHYLGITNERVERLEKHFANHSGKTLIIGKLSHAIGGAVLVAAGVSRMPFKKFLWYTFLPTLPKSLVLLLIGFYFGEAYHRINIYLDYTALAMVIIAIIFCAIYFTIKKMSAKYEEKNID